MRVDVRIIAATHQPLEELIRRGRIREDLYYRLNVISIRMPALRERREDIPDLATHFLRTYANQAKSATEGFDDHALELLEQYDWPGNIRELQNVVEHAVVMASGPTITGAELPIDLRSPVASNRPESQFNSADQGDQPTQAARRNGPLTGELGEIEKQRLLDALRAADGNKSQAARLLGIPRSTLCSKLQKFDIA